MPSPIRGSAHATQSTPTSTFTLPRPPDTEAGDLLVAHVVFVDDGTAGNYGTNSRPRLAAGSEAGWLSVPGAPDPGFTWVRGAWVTSRVFARQATDSDPSSWTWELVGAGASTTGRPSGGIIAVVDSSYDEHDHGILTTTGTPDVRIVSAAADDVILLFSGGRQIIAAPTWSPPAGAVTELWDIGSLGQQGTGAWAAWEPVPVPRTSYLRTPVRSYTGNGSQCVSHAVVATPRRAGWVVGLVGFA